MHLLHFNLAMATILNLLARGYPTLCDEDDEDLIFDTRSGRVRGTIGETRLGREIREFKGIPYAAPPVGDLRFEPPQPPKEWIGIRDATSYGNECLQKTGGHEDCLYLNVFTPPPDIATNLPVIFYIHGGFFKSGSSNIYGPGYFLDEDVILVTTNYRLHSLGFLNTADGLIKGNMGLKDQIAALQWVQDNIANFGGDASRVTIMGESAGGASVSYLLLSPLAKGLFHRAIAHSGTAFKVWSYQPKPEEQARLLAQRLNCLSNSSHFIVDCLKKADADDIVKYSTIGGSIKEDLNVFCPSVEVEGEGAAITKHPYDILTSGEATRVPWLTGINSGEGLLATIPIRLNRTLVRRINRNWSSLAPQFFYYDHDRTDITSKITQFYLGTETDINFRKQFSNFTRMFSDRLYISFTVKAAKVQPQYSDVYLYYNDYNFIPGSKNGVIHGGDVPLFFSIVANLIGPSSPHYNMSSALVNLWTQFAAGSDTLRVNGFDWTSVGYSQEGTPYLKIDNDGLEMAQDLLKDRLALWDEVNLYRIEPADTK